MANAADDIAEILFDIISESASDQQLSKLKASLAIINSDGRSRITRRSNAGRSALDALDEAIRYRVDQMGDDQARDVALWNSLS